jgi:dTDP-4-dehydrorhamnose reductase
MTLPQGSNVIPMCVTDRKGLEGIRDQFQPTHVIYCSGVCDLDACEQHPTLAHSINVLGPRRLAQVFGGSCHLLFCSSDLVFSGNYPPVGGYAEEHPPDPISTAGRTYADGEKELEGLSRCCIVRLGLPLGDSITSTKGAVDFIDHRFRRNLPLTLFHDELRSCIDCHTIAEIMLQLLNTEETGLYHLGGDRPWSLHEVGQYVIRRGNYPPELLFTKSRHEDWNGPPRIGDVTLNSGKIKRLMGLPHLS